MPPQMQVFFPHPLFPIPISPFPHSAMPQSTARYLLSDARKALSEDRLAPALDSIRGLAADLSAAEESDAAGRLAEEYGMLLDYMTRGADDPQRGKMYADFLRRAEELCDSLLRKSLLAGKETDYARTYTSAYLEDFTDLAADLRPGADYRAVFDAIWTAPPLSAAGRAAVEAYFTTPDTPLFQRCTAVGALTLSAVQIFDAARLCLLASLCKSGEAAIRARAMTGLCLALAVHADRLARRPYPALTAQLQLLTDDPARADELEEVQTQLLLALDTKEIERKISEQIMPEVKKRLTDLKLDRSLGKGGNPAEDLAGIATNPEWADKAANSEEVRRITHHMHEIYDMQQRGADIFIGSFRSLKQRFPFFATAANWFCPFSQSNPALPNADTNKDILALLTTVSFLCDSDKYSVVLMASIAPEAIRTSGMPEMASKAQALAATDGDAFATASFSDALRSCVQDLYRFFNLFPHRGGMENPFAHDLSVLQSPLLCGVLRDKSRTLRLADFCCGASRYEDTLRLYAFLPEKEWTADIWQKHGFCLQKTGQTAKAVESYRRALDLQPASAWTLRSLASCHTALQQYGEALKCHRRLQELPGGADDASLALAEGECLIRLRRHEDALAPLFKADYLRAAHPRTLRALAWCHLVLGRHDRAERYYVQILGGEPSPDDFLNAGHAALLSGRTAEAVRRYARHLTLRGTDAPRDFLSDDSEMLAAAGLSATDMKLLEEASARLADEGK